MPPQTPDRALKSFFDTWVYGTGIPSVKLSYTLNQLKLTGEVFERSRRDFSALVPVEVQSGNQKTVYWLPAGSDAIPFSISLKAPPTKVTLLAADCLIVSAR